MDLAWLHDVVIVALNTLVLFVWKPWAGAYAEEKGKNFARKEDLKVLAAEMKTLTEVQKGAEARILNAVWDRQTQWTQRRDIYARMLDSMVEHHASLADLLRIVERREEGQGVVLPMSPEAMLNEIAARAIEGAKSRSLARIFLPDEATKVLDRLSLSLQALVPTTASVNEVLRELTAVRDELVTVARRDLGVEF